MAGQKRPFGVGQLCNINLLVFVVLMSKGYCVGSDETEWITERTYEFSFPVLIPKDNKEADSLVPTVNYSLVSASNDSLVRAGNHSKSERLEVSETFEHTSRDSSSTFSYQEQTYEIFVKKCCHKGEAFIQSLNGCFHFETEFSVPGYITKQDLYVNISMNQMHIHEGLLTSCAPSILEREEFVLFDSGELYSKALKQYVHPDHYCIETIVDDSEVPPKQRLTAAYCPTSGLLWSFDPSKVPVRKCCSKPESVSSVSLECINRSLLTTSDWSVNVEPFGLISSMSPNFTETYEIVVGYPECVMNERGETLGQEWSFVILEANGYLDIPSLGIMTPNYCIDEYVNHDNQTAFAYVCLLESEYEMFRQAKPSRQSDSQYCAQKCCPIGHILNHKGSCERAPSYHSLRQPVPVYFSNGSVFQIDNVDFNILSPTCGSRGFFLTKDDEEVQILKDGSLRFVSSDPNECDPRVTQIIPSKDYCYDKVLVGDSKLSSRALVCYPPLEEAEVEATTRVNYIYSIFLVISDVFILISFVVYLTVPDQTKRGLNKNVKLGHSVFGRILLCFLFSLFFAYLSLAVTKTSSEAINQTSHAICIFLGIFMYVSFVASFFWLNVLCFEIWWKCARAERTSGRRWLWYQLYAWGNTFVCGCVVLFVEFSGSVGPCFVKPNFGIHTCFFSETKTFGSAAKWVYFNGPLAVLLLTDLMFFALTVKSLLQTVQQSHKNTVKIQGRQRLKLCFKLFLVMGICWLSEIISAITNTGNWYITEVFNCLQVRLLLIAFSLQGFVIFLIFIWKPKIRAAVHERICLVCCGREISEHPLVGGKLTLSTSVLSDFLSSTKRSPSPMSTAKPRTSAVSATSSLTLSYPSSSAVFPIKAMKVNKDKPSVDTWT